MIEAPRNLYRACVAAAILVTALTVGCGKKPVANRPTPVTTTAPASRPTVTLNATPSSINKGDTSTLTWTSTDATQVTIAPEVGTVTAQGSTKVTPTDSVTYTITASGPGGSVDASARVTISAPMQSDNAAPSVTGDELFLREVRDAYFDLDKADIRADAREALTKTADFLRNNPQMKVTIEGHCDERGSTEYNLGLGDRRASAVKQYLISLGISSDRLNTVSYGKEKPACMEATEDCYQKNRRGHFVKAN